MMNTSCPEAPEGGNTSDLRSASVTVNGGAGCSDLLSVCMVMIFGRIIVVLFSLQ